MVNIKDVGFDSAVCQNKIHTDEDKKNYIAMGYHMVKTEDETKRALGKNVDINNIYFFPSISMTACYLNRDTLAAVNLDILFQSHFEDEWVDKAKKAIAKAEEDVARGDYMGSMMCLTDAVQIEYLKWLSVKGADNLYDLFLSFYSSADYGFSRLDKTTVKRIVSAKTAEQRAATAETLASYDDILTVYRGENSKSTSYKNTYSWTLDINIANFFACRRGDGPARIIKATVKKTDIIEALFDRGEKEIIVFPNKCKVQEVIQLEDTTFLANYLETVRPVYWKYRERIYDSVVFADPQSIEHGKLHEARVLLMCLFLSEKLGLSASDRKILAEAAVYHDTMRRGDEVEPEHGKASRDYYESLEKRPNDIVAFLCEYHCLPDEQAYAEISNNRKLSKNRARARLLFDVFKDADALDRVRFGIRDVDLNQLRTESAKEMTLVARLCYEGIR